MLLIADVGVNSHHVNPDSTLFKKFRSAHRTLDVATFFVNAANVTLQMHRCQESLAAVVALKVADLIVH
jgi:hypothetical protein